MTERKAGLSPPGTKARRIQDAMLPLLGEHARQEHGLPTCSCILFYELEQRGLAVKPPPSDTRR
jgi:hypothetical protein